MEKEQLIFSLRNNGFSDFIVSAFEKVKREDFVFEGKEFSYEDTALSIGYGQTISQPYTIAFMLSLLELENKNIKKILEVGSGSGYVLALLTELVPNVIIYGIERVKDLVKRSKKVLEKKKNIKIFHSDGSKGMKKYAPFDRILVSAAANKVPQVLIDQLKVGGVLVIPIKDSILEIRKTSKGIEKKEFHGFVFVPLIED